MVDLCLLKCLRSVSKTLLAFTERGPTFQIKISKPGPVIEKVKETFIVQYQRPICDDPSN